MKLSVIIPVYNSEQHLKRCLDSVLAQRFTDFELLLIDDGSTDSSFEICQSYAQNDNRIRIIQKQNGGPGAARNLGISESKGEWIVFIDSDDWVDPNHLESLTDDIEEGIDLVMHGRYGGKQYLKYKNKIEVIDSKDNQILFNELNLTPNGQICSKLFNSKIIKTNRIEFVPEIRMSEDVLFILSYLTKSARMKYRDLYTYHYELNPDSLSQKQKWSFESNYLGFETINSILYNDFQIRAIENFPTLKTTVFNFLYRALKAILNSDYSRKERLKNYELLSVSNRLLDKRIGSTAYTEKMYDALFQSKFQTFDFLLKRWNKGGFVYLVLNKFFK